MPSGKVDKPVIQDNRDGTVSIHYEPREEGLHELHVRYNAEHVQGTLQSCKESRFSNIDTIFFSNNNKVRRSSFTLTLLRVESSLLTVRV